MGRIGTESEGALQVFGEPTWTWHRFPAVMTLIVVATLWLSVALGLGWGLAAPMRGAGATALQSAPVLGGGMRDVHAWQRFHFRAYPVALVFIAFEMEMMSMYPGPCST